MFDGVKCTYAFRRADISRGLHVTKLHLRQLRVILEKQKDTCTAIYVLCRLNNLGATEGMEPATQSAGNPATKCQNFRQRNVIENGNAMSWNPAIKCQSFRQGK
jgi:hypothetical protein